MQAVWEEVYRSDLARTYEADIEWFDARAMGPDARVELWVGVE
ncbi:MAG: hypothetical protein ACE37F_18905 [Nannocystaceae bacterium]|nr:hypothetical protein [bacterium]